MTRNDILGFVELLPVPDDSDLWDLVSDLLAKEVVKRLGDLDPKTVLVALCNAKADNTGEATDVADDAGAEGEADDVAGAAGDKAADDDSDDAGAEEDKAADDDSAEAPAEVKPTGGYGGGSGSYGSSGSGNY